LVIVDGDSIDNLKATPQTSQNTDILAFIESGEVFPYSSYSPKELGNMLQSRFAADVDASDKAVGTDLVVQKACRELAGMQGDAAGRTKLAQDLSIAACQQGDGRAAQW
jgi:hypothetical protein